MSSPVGSTRAPSLVHFLNLLGKVRREVSRAERAPGTEGQPISEVVVELGAHQNRALVLVQQGERDGRSYLETPLAVQAELAHGGSACERPGEQDLLRLGAFGECEKCERSSQHGHQPLRSLLFRDRHASPFAHHFGNR